MVVWGHVGHDTPLIWLHRCYHVCNFLANSIAIECNGNENNDNNIIIIIIIIINNNNNNNKSDDDDDDDDGDEKGYYRQLFCYSWLNIVVGNV